MDIITDAQYEVMAFVAACNRSFYNPTPEQVELWRLNREPRAAVYRTVRRELSPATTWPAATSFASTASGRMIAASFAEALKPMQDALSAMARQIVGPESGGLARYRTERELVMPAETMIEHLLRLGWLAEGSGRESVPGLRLSDLGRALLRDAEIEEAAEDEVGVVVLGREDPLAYPTLVGQLAAAGPGLFVDPYLKLADLHTIAVSTQLTRLLVSGKQQDQSVVASMSAYLDSSSLHRRVDVRSSQKLHDRVLLADDGDVLTVGTSLNGVGRTTTVMSPIPSPARESLREEYERLWSDGTQVGPRWADDEGDGDPSSDS